MKNCYNKRFCPRYTYICSNVYLWVWVNVLSNGKLGLEHFAVVTSKITFLSFDKFGGNFLFLLWYCSWGKIIFKSYFSKDDDLVSKLFRSDQSLSILVNSKSNINFIMKRYLKFMFEFSRKIIHFTLSFLKSNCKTAKKHYYFPVTCNIFRTHFEI